MASEHEIRVHRLEGQVNILQKKVSVLLESQGQLQTQQQAQQKPTWLMQMVNALKLILRNGFVWFGFKVDVDHGLVNGLSDDDHPQYCPVGIVIQTVGDVDPATIGMPGTWEAI